MHLTTKTILVIFLIIGFPTQANLKFSPEGKTPIDEVKILGVTVVDQDVMTVRKLLFDLGGFSQAKSTLRQKNIDKFYPVSQIRDSYYIEFKYNAEGQVHTVTRLLRYVSAGYNNRLFPIRTREIASEIASQIGQPTKIVRKSWGSGPSYNSYIWEGEKIIVTIDREGSDYYGNIFVRYNNKVDPFATLSDSGNR